ncbi:MAG: HIT family protein [Phycisphaerae bacterium]
MSEEKNNFDRHRNLWAPWRMEYIDSIDDGSDECFICRYVPQVEKDAENLVLWRGERSFVLMNRFPYTSGHTLIAPYEHVAELSDLPDETMLEMMHYLRDTKKILTETVNAEGFNAGINFGRCAGAGLPGHLHLHIVPRWGGDTNFMTVLGGVRVIPQSLEKLHTLMRETGERLDLPAAGK